MKPLLTVILAGIFSISGFTQQNILNDPLVQERVQDCLYYTYGFKFEKAIELQKILQSDLPDHPAPYFLKALITYWKYFPLLPADSETKEFERLMDKSLALSGRMLEKDPKSLEGIFFDLHSRAFIAMFWADNGKPARALLDLDNMYRMTMKGIILKEDFNEFYFSSGLYNYYIEAYVELHPVYKPIIAMFREGNKTLGLKELEYAADNTTYIQYETLLFLSLLYLNYENNAEYALDHAAELYNNFPDNIYYTGHYLIILLYNSKFTISSLIMDGIDRKKDDFHEMIYEMTNGFLLENKEDNIFQARAAYTKTIEIAESYGPIANIYAAIAYAGLERIAERKNQASDARKYHRKSRQLSVYEFILEYEIHSTSW